MVEPFLETCSYDPCYWFIHAERAHEIFEPGSPTAIVLHCGAVGADLYRYMKNPVTSKDDSEGVLCHDGRYRRQVSIHFAWNERRKCFVQMLPLTRRGWHVSGAKWKGQRIQDCSIGIEGAGPPTRERSKEEREAWTRLLLQLQVNDPNLALVITHQRLSPKDRQDPGPNLDWELMEKIGYKLER